MRFRYIAYTLEHGIVKGQVDARDEASARVAVVQQGYKFLGVRRVQRPRSLEEIFPAFSAVKVNDLIRFARQMAIMLNSGGNLLRGLEMITRESKNGTMRRALEAMRERVDEGKSLSEALSDHPRMFNPLFVRVVEVGEYTGRLGPALDQMADILEKEHEAKQKAMRTMMYPIAIMGLSLATLAVLMTVAMPPLLKVFEQMGSEIPATTRAALFLMAKVKANFANILLGGAGLFLGLKLGRRIEKVGYFFDLAQTKIPIIGPLTVAGELARFSRTMAMLLEAGVPLATALQLARSGCRNRVFRRAFGDAEEGLMNGHRLTEALRKYRLFPSIFVQLVMIGEESNSLRATMGDAATTYQKQVEQQLNSLLGMLEPASTVVVGGIIGFIALSMFSPIYSGLDGLGG